MSEKQPLTLDDLTRLVVPADAQLSPDGTQIAFTVRTVDVDKNRYTIHLWLVPIDGSTPPRQITRSQNSEGQPRFSEDGKYLFFTSAREDKKGQIYRLPLNGGEAERLTDLPQGGIGDITPSPDGKFLAFTFRPTDTEWREDAIEERKKKSLSTPVRVLERLRYRAEGAGFVPKEPYRLHLLNLETKELNPLELSDRDIRDFCWSPDGSRIAYIVNVSDQPDAYSNHTQLFIADQDGQNVTPLNTPLGAKGSLTWSPDGTHIAYIGSNRPEETWGIGNLHAWVAPLDGSPARDLTPDWDVSFGTAITGGNAGYGESGPLWNATSDAIYSLITHGGTVQAWQIPLSGEPILVTEGQHTVTGITYSPATDTLALLKATFNDCGNLYRRNPDGTLIALTTFNADYFAGVTLGDTRMLTATAPDGKEAPFFVAFPPGYAENPTPRPTILYIHGGPHLMYSSLFNHEFSLLAANGYVVIYPNPRGSQGYGEAWTGAIRGNWGEPAMGDCMAAIDYCIGQGWADSEKLGIAGGSYGGYLTLWTIGHTNRFKAAVPERGVYNLISMAGTCDFVWRDDHTYFAANTTSNPDEYWRNSPLKYVDAITTPTLLIHSEGDLRCPIEQAEQVFDAMKRQNKEVTFLRYGPETNHELSRSGPPDMRIDRLQRIVDFFNAHLQKGLSS